MQLKKAWYFNINYRGHNENFQYYLLDNAHKIFAFFMWSSIEILLKIQL